MAANEVIGLLRDFKSPNIFNPWRDVDVLDLDQETAAQWRRIRLEQHFDCTPKFLLIGEAPGYQGCHFSGVPFTNEKLLMDGAIPRIRMNTRITARDTPWSEPSATIVWRELHRLNIADQTVMWNAFAWHPHKPGNSMSNRAPTQVELREGSHVLRSVIELFPGAQVIAVGNVAELALSRLDVKTHGKVRHPSMGGATMFRDQLAALCGKKE